jgi:mono/diheme cytochrome c family protein
MRTVPMLLAGIALTACAKTESPPAAGNGGAQTAQAAAPSQQDLRLLAAAQIALPPEGLSRDSLPDPTSRGAGLLAGYCTQCHALPSPAMHARQDWPGVARRMWVRIDMMHGELGVAIPNEGDRVALLNYLLDNALKVADHLPAGAGRDVFAVMCSRCHTLPDPRSHSPADWGAVVMRMERNMEHMRVSGLTHDQTDQIVRYLQVASQR